MNFIESCKSRSALWKAVLLFILVSGLLIGADQLSMRCGFEGSQRMVDDLLGGLIACSIFYLFERHRLRRLSDNLHVIDIMNHHIRNALQPLMFLTYVPEGRKRMKLVEECVRSIDWALRDVLPGKSDERVMVTPQIRWKKWLRIRQRVRRRKPNVPSRNLQTVGPSHTEN
jgi:hypothetical protein